MSLIKTKSISDKVEPEDGIRILVTRYHPRLKGFTKDNGCYAYWYRELGPRQNLHKLWYSKEISEAYFIREYAEQFTRGTARDNLSIYQLEKVIFDILLKGQTVTLLCFEKEGCFCHRHLLKAILEERLRTCCIPRCHLSVLHHLSDDKDYCFYHAGANPAEYVMYCYRPMLIAQAHV